ncbi:MAG: hypothetical protein ACHQQQ_11725, partial [Bacteroidota bacterium]
MIKFAYALLLILILTTFVYSQTTVSTDITTSTTWYKSSSPYNVINNIAVAAGAVLSIQPGVRVQFNSGINMTINGVISANGNNTDSIYFTRNSSVGTWGNITINNTTFFDPSSQMSYCVVEYGGSSAINMSNSSTKLQVSNSLIRRNNY